MSACCSNCGTPECKCTGEIADRCHGKIPDKTAAEFLRDAKGYPLNELGDIDWEQTSKEKEAVAIKYNRLDGSTKKPHRKYPTNYTPPKRKRR